MRYKRLAINLLVAILLSATFGVFSGCENKSKDGELIIEQAVGVIGGQTLLLMWSSFIDDEGNKITSLNAENLTDGEEITVDVTSDINMIVEKWEGRRVPGDEEDGVTFVGIQEFGEIDTGNIFVSSIVETSQSDESVTNQEEVGFTFTFTNITNFSAFYRMGSANADGTMLVFESDRDGPPVTERFLTDVFVINTDGTGLIKVLTDAGYPSFTPDGRIIFVRDTDQDNLFEIWIADADGSNPQLLVDDDQSLSLQFIEPVVSPDGSRIAATRIEVVNGDVFFDIVVGDFDGMEVTNLSVVTSEGTVNINPAWSLESDSIAFTSNRTGDDEIWLMNPDGTEQTQFTVNPDGFDVEPFFLFLPPEAAIAN